MNNNTKVIFAFVAGVVVGAAASCKYFKTKYEKRYQRERDSLIEYFGGNKPEDIVTVKEPVEHTTKSDSKPQVTQRDISDYEARIKNSGYTDYTEFSRKEQPKPEVTYKKPYLIPPEELGGTEGDEDYNVYGFTYYADGVLADDADMMVEDIENVVGLDFADYFGEYEDDAVHIRNERLRCDYEILRDLRKYSDVLEDKPYLRGN